MWHLVAGAALWHVACATRESLVTGARSCRCLAHALAQSYCVCQSDQLAAPLERDQLASQLELAAVAARRSSASLVHLALRARKLTKTYPG